MQKKQHEKVVKSKVVAQKWLWWSDNGKIFNYNNSGKFVLPHKFTRVIVIKNFAIIRPPQPGTSGPPPLISQLFSGCFFCMGHTFFLQFGCFYVDTVFPD